MNYFNQAALTAILPLVTLSATLEAKPVLSAAPRCFQIGDVKPGGWRTTLKIRPQQGLPDKQGTLVEVIALEHGEQAVHPPLEYTNELVGSATYIPPGGGTLVADAVQMSLVGTSYGSDDGTASGTRGVYALTYTLTLEPQVKNKIPGATLTGYKTFKPVGGGHDGDPATLTVIEAAMTEISCRDF